MFLQSSLLSGNLLSRKGSTEPLLTLDPSGSIINAPSLALRNKDSDLFQRDCEHLVSNLAPGAMTFILTRPSSNTPDQSAWFHVATLACLVASMSYLAAKLGTTVVIRPQVDWPLWPANILVVCALLPFSRRLWPILIAAALVAFAIYNCASAYRLVPLFSSSCLM